MQMTQHRGTWEPTPVKQNRRLGLLLFLLVLLVFFISSLERALFSSLLKAGGQPIQEQDWTQMLNSDPGVAFSFS